MEESYTCARQYDLALYDWEDLQSTDQIREGSIIWLYGDCSAEFNKSVLYKAKLYSHFNKALLINKNN